MSSLEEETEKALTEEAMLALQIKRQDIKVARVFFSRFRKDLLGEK